MTTKRQYLCPTTTTLVVKTMQMMVTSPTLSEGYDVNNSRHARERSSYSDDYETQTTDGSTDTWGGLW